MHRRIVVAGAGYGAGHERVADAVADSLRRHPTGQARVLQVDLLGRCAPKALQLASMAWRGGEAFFPDAVGSLAELVSSSGQDPLVRELVSGGIAAAEATLKALEPDVVVATHPAAGGIAAEVADRCGFEVFVVLPDLMPDRFWLHPGVALWFAAGTDARDELARRRVDWSRIAVTGVPQETPRSRVDARRALVPAGFEDRFTVLLADLAGTESAAESLRAVGIQTIVEGGRRAAAGAPGAAAIVRPPAGMARPDLLAAADVVLTTRCGSLTWEATAAGTPLVAVGEGGRMEQASIDLLVDAGAALQARDIQDATRRAAYLAAHPARESALAEAMAGLARPHAAKAVAERVLAALD